MKDPVSLETLIAATGKTIATAKVVTDGANVHGILLIFTDGTECSVDFYAQAFTAEVSYYRWSDSGEVIDLANS